MAAWVYTVVSCLIAADPQLVRLNGVVLLPDGKPAVNAKVTGACWHSPTVKATTDRDGKFTLESEFAGPANITVLSVPKTPKCGCSRLIESARPAPRRWSRWKRTPPS